MTPPLTPFLDEIEDDAKRFRKSHFTDIIKLVRLVRELIKQRDGEARVAGYLFSGTVEERIQRDNADLEAILKDEL